MWYLLNMLSVLCPVIRFATTTEECSTEIGLNGKTSLCSTAYDSVSQASQFVSGQPVLLASLQLSILTTD